jgi:regulator of nucleoside diphosphate kinase
MSRISPVDCSPKPAAAPGNLLAPAIGDSDLPVIAVTKLDAIRLGRVVGDLFQIRTKQVAFLARELDRARIVDPAEIPAGVATMRSVVEFRVDNGGKLSRAMLVYPAKANVSSAISALNVSVLTPIGTALLGLSEGQSMPYEGVDGRIRRLTIHKVVFQPEAAGMGWL